MPMIAGSTPAVAQRHDPRQRRDPALRGLGAFISTTAAAPSLMPEALAAVTVPSLSKAGLKPGDAVERDAARGYIRPAPR